MHSVKAETCNYRFHDNFRRCAREALIVQLRIYLGCHTLYHARRAFVRRNPLNRILDATRCNLLARRVRL